MVIQPDGSYHYYESKQNASDDNVCWGLIDNDWTKEAVKKGFSYENLKITSLNSPSDCQLGVFGELRRKYINCTINLTSKISTAAYASDNKCITTPIFLYTWTRP